MEAIFRNLCPNCGGDISSERLLEGLPCENCMPDKKVGEALCSLISLKGLRDYCKLKDEYEKWEEIFRNFVGFYPWELQKFWARKLLLGRSFALLAPTGIGKTSLGLASSIYFAKKNKKSYIILPTRLLILQSYEKLKDKVREKDLLVFGLDETKKEKEEKREKAYQWGF